MQLSFSRMPVRWWTESCFRRLLVRSGLSDSEFLRMRPSAAASLARQSWTPAILSTTVRPGRRVWMVHSLYHRRHCAKTSWLLLPSRSEGCTGFLGSPEATSRITSSSCSLIQAMTSALSSAPGSMGKTRGSDASPAVL